MSTITPSISSPASTPASHGAGPGGSQAGGATIVPDPALPVPIRGIELPALHQKYMREGTCMFRELRIQTAYDAEFQKAWVANKRAFIERGFSLKKNEGSWFLQQWLLVGQDRKYRLTSVGREKLADLQKPRTQGTLALAAQTIQRALVLPDLHSNIEQKLRPYQIEPTKQLLRALKQGVQEWGYPGAVDFSDMGTGKTFQTLAAGIAAGRDIGVLCPTVGAGGWNRALAHFGVTPLFVSTYEAVRGAWRPHIATMDGTGKFTWQHPNELLLILDEAQALRHEDTLTVRCVAAAIRQGIPIIVASATIATSPLEMRFAGRVTGLHKGDDDWHRFLVGHGCFKKSRGTNYIWDGRTHHLDRINRQLFPFRGARVRKQDLGEECPETIIEPLPFDIPEAAKIEQEWKDTQAMLERVAAQQGEAVAKKRESIARMQMWKRCEMVLVPYVAERIRADVKGGKSVAVFMNFNESRIALSRLLNTNAGFYGGQNIKHRQHYEKEFQANRLHILINNIGAGGASVSLHDTTGDRPRVAYIFPTDDVVKMEQATGRVDRVGGKTLSLQFIPFVKGLITERMIERTRRKMRNISSINDGSNSTGARF